MVGIAISLLWFLIGVIVLAGIIFLVLYGIKNIAQIPVPARLEQGVWFIFLILCVIYLLSVLVGGGGFATPHFR